MKVLTWKEESWETTSRPGRQGPRKPTQRVRKEMPAGAGKKIYEVVVKGFHLTLIYGQ